MALLLDCLDLSKETAGHRRLGYRGRSVGSTPPDLCPEYVPGLVTFRAIFRV